jgi:hypothetical protein
LTFQNQIQTGEKPQNKNQFSISSHTEKVKSCFFSSLSCNGACMTSGQFGGEISCQPVAKFDAGQNR